MTPNLVGIIVCVAMVICGIGCYFIGRLHGIEWASEHMTVDLAKLDIHPATHEETEELFRLMKEEREKDDERGQDSE